MIPDRIYDFPVGEIAPTRNMTCIGCGKTNTLKGQWNKHTGRWLIAFNCHHCELSQQMFVSRAAGKEQPQPRAPFKDE